MAMTKREMYAIIKTADFEGCAVSTDEIIAFINHEIELLDRKHGGERKPTAKQVENEVIKSAILEYLITTGEMVRVGDLPNKIEVCEGISPQRLTALMTQLSGGTKPTGNEPIIRMVEKKVAYYKAR